MASECGSLTSRASRHGSRDGACGQSRPCSLQSTPAPWSAWTKRAVGSCVTTLQDNDAAQVILGVPAELSCSWTITFGYPAEAPAPLKAGGRRPLKELVRFERYS